MPIRFSVIAQRPSGSCRAANASWARWSVGVVVPSDRWRISFWDPERRARKWSASVASMSAMWVAAGFRSRVVGGLDVADQASEVGDDRRLRQRDALAGGGATQQGPGLDVAHDRGDDVRVGAEDLHRPGDQAVVVGVRRGAPLVAVRVRLGHLPQAQHVVGQVVVQLDHAGQHGAAGRGHRDVLEARRRGCGSGEDGDDGAVAAVQHPGVDDRGGGVQGRDPAAQRQRRARGGIRVRRHQHSCAPNAGVMGPSRTGLRGRVGQAGPHTTMDPSRRIRHQPRGGRQAAADGCTVMGYATPRPSPPDPRGRCGGPDP